jgi:hypothetical protein
MEELHNDLTKKNYARTVYGRALQWCNKKMHWNALPGIYNFSQQTQSDAKEKRMVANVNMCLPRVSRCRDFCYDGTTNISAHVYTHKVINRWVVGKSSNKNKN